MKEDEKVEGWNILGHLKRFIEIGVNLIWKLNHEF